MAGYLTTYGATATLNGTPMPTTWYVQGHLDNPGVDADLHPALETRRLTAIMDTAVDGVTQNASRAVLGGGAAATEDWSHVSLWDASSSGNPWWVVPLATVLSLTVGQAIILPDGVLVLELTRWT